MSECKQGADGASSAEEQAAPRRRVVSRRSLLAGGASAAVLMGVGGLSLFGAVPEVRPPGGQDEQRLIATCVRCQKCYEACPRKVIVPARLEDGLAGFRTPVLDFSNDYCDFCVQENGGNPLCAATCPTQALSLSLPMAPESAVLGVASINSHDCLAFRNTGCRFCYDACPYGAIEMSDGGKNARPQVVTQKCNGCGACESVCVSLESGSIASAATRRAIVVLPVDSHEAGGAL